MKRAMLRFWSDECGFVVTAELVIVGTVVVLGLIAGLSSLQSAIVFELNDMARAFCSLNQSFVLPGFFACRGARTVGSGFVDTFNGANCGFGAFGGGGVGAGGFGGGFGVGFGGGASGGPIGLGAAAF